MNLAVKIKAGAGMLGLSVGSFKRYVVPHVRQIRVGRNVLYDTVEITEWWEHTKTAHGREGIGERKWKKDRPASSSEAKSGTCKSKSGGYELLDQLMKEVLTPQKKC